MSGAHLDALLERHFGFAGFRPGQREACAAAIAGRDVLVVMPTGSGKSLCYQLPALARDDLTIVVSPLVSLMQDQVDALSRRAPGRVALINAQQDAAANAEAARRALAGELRLLYVAPERFAAPGFVERLAAAKVGLFVVDEAHCVSQWGHDFRPDYFRLAEVARAVGAQSLVASTATATPLVAGDVIKRLGLRDPLRISTGFDRPNLTFAVVPCATTREKELRLAAALREPGSLPAIVYAGTRAVAESLAVDLGAALGVEALAYHAGLERDARALAQERFMSGDVSIVVATNAFGMGIDKADVRTVAHANVPSSLEAWYQEAGRAGRDGAPARALLFAENRDKGLHVFFIQRGESGDGSPEATSARWRDYRAVWGFVESRRCRRDAVMRHFGDPAPPAPEVPCCDVCDPAAIPPPVDLSQARRGSRARGSRSRSARGGRSQARRPSTTTAPAELDEAIVATVAGARPAVGRTRTVEILRGSRSQAIERNSYDGLPSYGTFAHLPRETVLERVDQLIEEGRLRSSGGRYPVLKAA
jgi:ATP-dependent DNA helicase RecQ